MEGFFVQQCVLIIAFHYNMKSLSTVEKLIRDHCKIDNDDQINYEGMKNLVNSSLITCFCLHNNLFVF